jgi:2-polyprenyl-6-methoxyphenol hydroxylase-like FAD-dependent oxidoreductase
MTRTATVVGAGIAGPVAALNLQQQGYDVTILEKRDRSEINSTHMLTILPQTADMLDQLGIERDELFRYDSQFLRRESSDGRRMVDGFTRPWPTPPNVCWNDLHDALASRCDVSYGHRVASQPDTDIVVWADGVGSYGRKSHGGGRGTYAGEMLLRGSVPRSDDDMTWFTFGGSNAGTYSMVSYPTWERDGSPIRGWTLFLPVREMPWGGTQALTPGQRDTMHRIIYPRMHDRPYDLVESTTDVIASPQYVWPPVRHMATHRDGRRMVDGFTVQREFFIGDAVGSVSPRTTMGANLAVLEGCEIGRDPRWDSDMVPAVNQALEETREFVNTAITRER